jgi:cytochrome P450
MMNQAGTRIRGPASAVVSQLRYLKNPYQIFSELSAKYGDPFRVPSFECNQVVTGQPEGIRTIFSADPAIFDPLNVEIMTLLFGEGSLLALTGERHRAARKLQAPPFHGARMQAYATLIRERTLARLVELPSGQPFSAEALTQAISLDVIIEAVFGVSDRQWMDRFHAAIRELIAAIKPSFFIFKFMRFELAGMTAYARFVRARNAVNAMLAEAIAARRAAAQDGPDILGMLLAARYEDGAPVPDVEVITQLLTMVLAGHETTGMALQWALYELHRTPSVLDKLRTELDGVVPDALPRLPYLGAVCDETLRLWPLFPAIARKLNQPLELCGYTVPAGHAVLASVYLAHRREEVYPEPERFIPERFLERSFSPFEYLPFGGGARRCLGAAFALFEMKIVLGTLLTTARFRLVSDKPIRLAQRNIAVGPARPIQLVRE